MTDPRHVTRVLVFQCLCLLDAQGDDALPMLRRFLDEHAPDAETAARAEELARRVWRERDALDQKVAAAAERWSVARMQIVDRGILRLGAFEILLDDRVPAAVAINEAVEIAKEFAGADSPGFVNGILDSVRKAAEAEPTAQDEAGHPGVEDKAEQNE
ncbi:MAG: transcription antitermination factor NusB [Phycisphaerales bacterium]|nr:MAG: transcription antitermination factor NusB [Phycisphaerales bacterium]